MSKRKLMELEIEFAEKKKKEFEEKILHLQRMKEARPDSDDSSDEEQALANLSDSSGDVEVKEKKGECKGMILAPGIRRDGIL